MPRLVCKVSKAVAKSSSLLWDGVDVKGRCSVKDDVAILVFVELSTDISGYGGVSSIGESVDFGCSRRIVSIGSRSVRSCNRCNWTRGRSGTLVVVVVG